MDDKWIFVPVLVQILHAVIAYVRLAVAKHEATRSGELNESRRGLHDDAWPDSVVRVLNNIRNQFEVPVLFYVVVIMLWELDAATAFSQVFAWLFVISRGVNDYIQTGKRFVPVYRYVKARRRVFAFGWVMVLVLASTVAKVLIFGE